ncbi:MAG: glycosyltransferase [Acidobacteriota bacterium]
MNEPAILWASPLPPTRSGVADYAAELLPELVTRTAVTLAEPPDWHPEAGSSWLAGLPRIAPGARLPGDAVPVLHLGNNPYHLWVVGMLRTSGGIVVLHDTVLHHLRVEEAALDGDWPAFQAELRVAHGDAGAALAQARRWGFHGPADAFLFPARTAYLRLARGVIVHNRRAARDVASSCPGVPVRQVPLAVAALPAWDRTVARARLGVHDDELLLVHLGFLTPAKGMGTILEALCALRDLGIRCRLVVVGEGSDHARAAGLVEALGLADRVTLTGWATRETLGSIVSAADLGLVPRYPTAGESSAAALRFLAAGTPAVVAGYRQFLELPEAATPRVTPGRGGIAELVRVVADLAGNPERRALARRAALRAWEEGGHAPAAAAERLLHAITEITADVAR